MNKLESTNVSNFLCTYDIICLHEIKTPMRISFPGFMCYRSCGENQHRGGCAVLLKNWLRDEVLKVSFPVADSVWMNLRCLQDVTIITCYLPPSDSPYHSFAPITEICSQVRTRPDERYIVIGDLNARFANLQNAFLDGKAYQKPT